MCATAQSGGAATLYPVIMKAAVIYFSPLATTSAVGWRWRSTDGTAQSSQSFTHYCDCLKDALTKGYSVGTAQQHPDTPPPEVFSVEHRDQYERFLAAEPGPTRH